MRFYWVEWPPAEGQADGEDRREWFNKRRPARLVFERLVGSLEADANAEGRERDYQYHSAAWGYVDLAPSRAGLFAALSGARAAMVTIEEVEVNRVDAA